MGVKDIKNLLRNYKKIETQIKILRLDIEENPLHGIDYNNTKVSTSNINTLDNHLEHIEHIETKIKLLELQKKKIEIALEALNERERKVIELRYIKDNDYNTVAYAIDREYSTIKVIEHKAMSKMLDVLIA